MQDQRHIAGAFGAWQRANQKLCEAELRLESALDMHRRGLAPSPDALRNEVLSFRAEQEWRFDAAADALRRKHSGSMAAVRAAPSPHL